MTITIISRIPGFGNWGIQWIYMRVYRGMLYTWRERDGLDFYMHL